MAADVVLTTKSLAAQRSGRDLNDCTANTCERKPKIQLICLVISHGHGTEHQVVVTDGQA